MIIEVTGTGTHNKGAELMLIAIKEHFASFPDVKLAVSQFFGTYQDRTKYSLLQKVDVNSWGRSRIASSLMPASFRQAFGLVTDGEVDVLLDASGFAFGDQHPAGRTIHFAKQVEIAKKKNKKVILMPQALGPFEEPEMQQAFNRIVNAADLVFARDTLSLEYVQRVVGVRQNLHQAPDFTNLVKPKLSTQSDHPKRVSIIPNRQMIVKTQNDQKAKDYISLIGRCIKVVKDSGLESTILIHGEEDVELAEAIRKEIESSIDVHREDNPIKLKQFIGESHLVIGSRFHALVSALSQGVPAIGTSWSHKYEMLFEEYGCEDMILQTQSDDKYIQGCVEQTIGENRQSLVKKIKSQSDQIMHQTNKMWEIVDSVVL